MARIVIMKPGVGDHPAERVPPHEHEIAMQLLRDAQRRNVVDQLIRNAYRAAREAMR